MFKGDDVSLGLCLHPRIAIDRHTDPNKLMVTKVETEYLSCKVNTPFLKGEYNGSSKNPIIRQQNVACLRDVIIRQHNVACIKDVIIRQHNVACIKDVIIRQHNVACLRM